MPSSDSGVETKLCAYVFISTGNDFVLVSEALADETSRPSICVILIFIHILHMPNTKQSHGLIVISNNANGRSLRRVVTDSDDRQCATGRFTAASPRDDDNSDVGKADEMT